MLGTWHRGEWLKRDMDQPFYGQVERGSTILGLNFASLMKGYFSLYFYDNFDGLYMVYMGVLSWVFLLLLCSLCMFFMTTSIYGFHHVFPCN